MKVSLALGFDEIKRLFASEKSVYAFDDKGIFSKEGVLILGWINMIYAFDRCFS